MKKSTRPQDDALMKHMKHCTSAEEEKKTKRTVFINTKKDKKIAKEIVFDFYQFDQALKDMIKEDLPI